MKYFRNVSPLARKLMICLGSSVIFSKHMQSDMKIQYCGKVRASSHEYSGRKKKTHTTTTTSFDSKPKKKSKNQWRRFLLYLVWLCWRFPKYIKKAQRVKKNHALSSNWSKYFFQRIFFLNNSSFPAKKVHLFD